MVANSISHIPCQENKKTHLEQEEFAKEAQDKFEATSTTWKCDMKTSNQHISLKQASYQLYLYGVLHLLSSSSTILLRAN